MYFNSVGEGSVNQPALSLTKWMTHVCCVDIVFIWVKCKILQTRGLQEFCLKERQNLQISIWKT